MSDKATVEYAGHTCVTDGEEPYTKVHAKTWIVLMVRRLVKLDIKQAHLTRLVNQFRLSCSAYCSCWLRLPGPRYFRKPRCKCFERVAQHHPGHAHCYLKPFGHTGVRLLWPPVVLDNMQHFRRRRDSDHLAVPQCHSCHSRLCHLWSWIWQSSFVERHRLGSSPSQIPPYCSGHYRHELLPWCHCCARRWRILDQRRQHWKLSNLLLHRRRFIRNVGPGNLDRL